MLWLQALQPSLTTPTAVFPPLPPLFMMREVGWNSHTAVEGGGLPADDAFSHAASVSEGFGVVDFDDMPSALARALAVPGDITWLVHACTCPRPLKCIPLCISPHFPGSHAPHSIFLTAATVLLEYPPLCEDNNVP